MKKDSRILLKIVAVVILTLLFIWLVYKDERTFQMTQPEGALAEAGDMKILIREMQKSGAGFADEETLNRLLENAFQEEGEPVSYDSYLTILESMLGKGGQGQETDGLKKSLTYKERYQKDFFLLKEDWYNSFEKLIDFYGLKEQFQRKKIEILCGNSELAGEEKIGEGKLLSGDGTIYDFASDRFADLKFITINAYVKENTLLTLADKLSDKGSLSNVWIMEAGDGKLQFFYEGYEIMADADASLGEQGQMREQMADISYKSGDICKVQVKEERIGGKLLGIDEDWIEIEGHGKVPVKEELTGYMLYERLRKAFKEELSIGYDFADFVLEKGKICGFLITKKEKMETIRVAVKNNGFGSLYHECLRFVSRDDMTLSYGSYDHRREEKIPAGQELLIEPGSDYLAGDRVELVPDVNTGRIQVLSLNRSQGTPSYRGRMEIHKTEEGLVLINEVLLEEYLYSVVPSEMPASYPAEALKAQAVCARTYGYRYLKEPGYQKLGAHVDDSVGYQVYNNIAENINSTKAVKETAGMLLLYEEKPVNAYYYSTSCGFGADAGVWNEDQADKMPYLRAEHIGNAGEEEEPEDFSADVMGQEEDFRSYITSVDESAYEKEEAWFRWRYQVEDLDVSLLARRLGERFEAGAGKILTYTGSGEAFEEEENYQSVKPEKFKEVYDIRCLKRKEGGVMDELLIETDKGSYKIISEYNIRYVLNQGGEVIRQDGSPYESKTLLPSAYLVIDVETRGEDVVGYTIIGGGYGHGVGMSQNGAKAMGAAQMSCEEILSFYFQGCQLDKIY